MLESELDHELGYSKYDYKNKSTENSRNGYSKKSLKSDYGELEINVPRDRQSEFEPTIVKKNQRYISSIEDQVLSMYAKGMSQRDMEKHLKDIYGIDASPDLISRITDKIIPLVTEWTAYTAIGVNLDGIKDVLGIWIGENESSKFWLSVITQIKNRGVKDILIASVDGLSGFNDAIKAVFF